MSTSTTGGATTTQPVGPAAPPAARLEQPAAPPVEPRAHVTLFLHPIGTGFDSISLAVRTASLLAGAGKLAALEIAPAGSVEGGAFGLIAYGDVAPGKYAGLTLQPPADAHHVALPSRGDGQRHPGGSSLAFAAGRPAAGVRVPRSVDLAFAPVELPADGFSILVITLDLADLRAADEVALGARRFRAGLLSKEEACELKGEVAPAAALARAYACWADTGVALAMTQPDPFTGQYAISGLPPGEYRLRIIAAGYEPYRGPDEPLTLTAGAAAQAAAVTLAAGPPLDAAASR